jgi:hypothetical protein
MTWTCKILLNPPNYVNPTSKMAFILRGPFFCKLEIRPQAQINPPRSQVIGNGKLRVINRFDPRF